MIKPHRGVFFERWVRRFHEYLERIARYVPVAGETIVVFEFLFSISLWTTTAGRVSALLPFGRIKSNDNEITAPNPGVVAHS